MTKYLLLTLFILLTTPISAQATKSLNIAVIRHHTPNDIADSFIQAYRTELATENIHPTFIEEKDLENYPLFWEADSISLIFPYSENSQTSVLVTPYVTMHLSISDYLDATYDFGAGIIFRELDFKDAVDHATGIALYAVQNCPSAKPYLENSLKTTSGSPLLAESVHFYLGNCALLENGLADARKQFEMALPDDFLEENSPIFSSTAFNLAWTRFQQGDALAATRLMNQVVAQATTGNSPFELTQALVRRSRLNAIMFNYAEAVDDMNEAVELCASAPYSTRCPDLYVERGQRILMLYEWDRALADYNHALELDPTYADAYYYRGILYASVPEGIDARRDALADFQHYLELTPDGWHAADAARYAAEIQAQLDALNQGS